jgi:hypothetical protein
LPHQIQFILSHCADTFIAGSLFEDGWLTFLSTTYFPDITKGLYCLELPKALSTYLLLLHQTGSSLIYTTRNIAAKNASNTYFTDNATQLIVEGFYLHIYTML